MSRLTLTVLLNIILAYCWLPTPAISAASLNNDSADKPIHIEADRMESDQRKESVLFVGNIEATQGDLVPESGQAKLISPPSEPRSISPPSGGKVPPAEPGVGGSEQVSETRSPDEGSGE